MFDTITVPQEHGKDSIVEVSEEVRDGWPDPVRLLHFYTSQSLTSQSGRAWNVNKAIENYCKERGYVIEQENQHSATARYDSRAHSQQAWHTLQQLIKNSRRYIEAKAIADEKAEGIQVSYGQACGMLKNLVRELERRAQTELDAIATGPADAQRAILSELDLPSHLSQHDLDSLERPLYRPTLDHYRNFAIGLPNDLDTILALLD